MRSKAVILGIGVFQLCRYVDGVLVKPYQFMGLRRAIFRDS